VTTIDKQNDAVELEVQREVQNFAPTNATSSVVDEPKIIVGSGQDCDVPINKYIEKHGIDSGKCEITSCKLMKLIITKNYKHHRSLRKVARFTLLPPNSRNKKIKFVYKN